MSDFTGVALSGPGMVPRFARRGRNIRNRRRRRRAPTNRTLNKKIKSIQSKQELGHLDTFQDGTGTVDNAGVLTLLNGIAEGDDDTNRHGREIHATSIQFRIRYIASTSQLSTTFIRTIVLWDLQANGAAPTVAQILDSSVITTIYLAPYNRGFQKRFKILYDKTIGIVPQVPLTVTAGATTAVVTTEHTQRAKIKLSRVVKYIGTTGAITSIGSNSLYLLQVSDVSTNLPSTNSGFRFYFKDD